MADLDRAVPTVVARDGGEGCQESGDADPAKLSQLPTPPRTAAAATVESASRASDATVADTLRSSGREDDTLKSAVSAAADRCSYHGTGVRKHGQASPAITAPAAMVVGLSRANKALVELRSELGRHLAAVACVLDGGRHLREATRVMREIEKLEALERLAEVSIPSPTWARAPSMFRNFFRRVVRT